MGTGPRAGRLGLCKGCARERYPYCHSRPGRKRGSASRRAEWVAQGEAPADYQGAMIAPELRALGLPKPHCFALFFSFLFCFFYFLSLCFSRALRPGCRVPGCREWMSDTQIIFISPPFPSILPPSLVVPYLGSAVQRGLRGRDTP